ncbi:unnamed protein product [Allacma fusca]|uniref:SHC-transforming protein 1 n=1 Tax=Allacma fusca TaxID=39272 RepID=A0A8J2PZK4_9HEXA|nr:unnamed protein product [Allacma fusca]
MKMTELTRMFKCFSGKSYHALQDDYSRISLISQGDSSVESVLDSPSVHLEAENVRGIGSDKLRVRPRSAGDITETLRAGRDVVIVPGSLTPTESHHAPQFHVQSTNNNNSNNNNSGGSGGGGGGFLSFLGSRFNKSGTRHLDRSGISSDATSDKPGKTLDSDHRYTKFPLSFSAPSQQQTQQQQPASVPVQTDSRFDATHIQLTPQTKTYTLPHKSPVPPVKGIIHGANANKFLAHAVSSLGRKSKESSSHHKSRHKNNKAQLAVKSKSDNSLHRVTLQGVNNNSPTNVLSPNFYPQGEQRLNSVQLGDHATIRLPWTGFQPQQLNNLSSVTPSRAHPNTHNNNLFDLEAVRYVECGGLWSGTRPVVLPSSASRAEDHPRRRARSLERASNFRVFPANSSVVKEDTSNLHSHSSSNKKSARGSNSLERPSRHRIRQSLSPSEQEILLRNLAHLHRHPVDLPPALPKKKARPPPLGKLHRSAPTSSLSSVESSSSDSASASCTTSAPPSPPPRPLSTLRPESRLIISSKVRATERTDRESRSHRCSSNINSGGSQGTVGVSMNPPNRRPVVPRPDHSLHSSTTHDIPTMAQSDSSVSLSSASAAGMSLEDARNSGFINKPSKGWLHPDQLLSKEGVTYTVRYIGCLDVNTSMKSLDFETRSLIAKECINQVCESAGLKSIDKKRKTDRRLVRILGLRPRLDQAGSDVHLTITSTCLKLTSLDTGVLIATHDLPNISFASGGDPTMLDFVAYVAKDAVIGRACFVLECGSGRAQDVITTVGQAFELRFKEYLQKRPAPPPRVQNEDPDREYYNDLPGKVPPELPMGASANSVLRSGQATSTAPGNDCKDTGRSRVGNSRARGAPGLTLPTSSLNDSKGDLIDFEAPTPPAFGPSRNLEALLLNDGAVTSSLAPQSLGSVADGHGNGLGGSGLNSPSSNDPFNMQPFGNSLPTNTKTLSAEEQKAQLELEPWFHGIISRSEAEALVRNDGDFLVRESQASPGQYVLTGLQNGSSKHLLLVDPEGVVRTKDREFDSVIHLIKYHSDNSLPIISAESMVLLRHPVLRPNKVISSS